MAKYDNKFLKNSIFVFLLVLILMVIYKTLDNLSTVFSYIIDLTVFACNLLMPFIYAFFIAYFLNPFVKYLEEHLFKRDGIYLAGSRKRRSFSILILYMTIILLLALLINYIIPVIASNIKELIKNIPDYLSNTERYIKNLPSKFITSKSAEINQKTSELIAKYAQKINEESVNKYFSRIMEGILRFTIGFFKAFLGFIIAVYFMLDKEKINKGTGKLITAVFSERNAWRIKNLFNKINAAFSSFIIGKFIDSLIVAVLCLLLMILFKVKYPVLISIIVGISNMIPYFGPIAGAVPVVLITFLYSPGKAILVAVLLLALQQFDGNYLEVKILGDSMGLSPLWIIFAILVGGGFFGIFGMFISVPAAAVIKSFISEWIDKKIENKSDHN